MENHASDQNTEQQAPANPDIEKLIKTIETNMQGNKKSIWQKISS